MNKLTITADREDYSVGLKGTLLLNGFSGYGEGWFNNSDVKEFCSKIESLTNNMSGATELIGSQSMAEITTHGCRNRLPVPGIRTIVKHRTLLGYNPLL